MTNNPTTLLKAFLITTTALAIVPAVSTNACAQDANPMQPPVAAPQQPTPQTRQPVQNQQLTQIDQSAQTDSETSQEAQTQADPTPGGPPQPAAQTEQAGDVSDIDPAAGSPTKREANEIDPIVVTGSNIRGALPAGSKVDIITSDELLQSGHVTIERYFETYAQNYQGAISEDGSGATVNAATNFSEGTGLNLRGLGTSSTLVLVNGRRQPSAGLGASFSDISMVPTSAIERVEILSDGGSALYGTDAIAGVVNIVLKKQYEGAETRAHIGTVTGGDSWSYQLGQTFGTSWKNGNLLLSYEFYRRTPMSNADRPYMATADYRPWGGNDRRVLGGNPGTISSSSTGRPTYGIPKNQNGASLSVSDLLENSPNRRHPNGYEEIVGLQRKHSAFLYIEQAITDTITAFAEARYSYRWNRHRNSQFIQRLNVPSSNPYFLDPYGDSASIDVYYDLTPDVGLITNETPNHHYNAATGLTIDLSPKWQARYYASYTRENSKLLSKNRVNSARLPEFLRNNDPDVALNPFGDGSHTNPRTIDQIRQEMKTSTNSRIFMSSIILDGPLIDVGQNTIRLAVGADYLDLAFKAATSTDNISTMDRDITRSVKALFAELNLPVFRGIRSSFGESGLELSAAGRIDDYSDAGTTANPKLGLRWGITDRASFRATWGTSFRAPNLPDRDETLNSYSYNPLPNLVQPGQTLRVLSMNGGNADLTNEKSTNITLGITWKPLSTPTATISIDYFQITFKDRVAAIRGIFEGLANPDRYPGIIIFNPTQQQLNRFCSQPYQFNSGSDRSICNDATRVDVLVDQRLNNVSSSTVRGIDAKATLTLPLAATLLGTADVNASYIIDYKERLTPVATPVERVDTIRYPADLRIRGGIHATYKSSANASLFVNYTDGYMDTTPFPNRRVTAHTTFDFTFTLTMPGTTRSVFFRDTSLSLSIINLTNNEPPFVDSTLLGYDPGNADPFGRTFSVNLIKRW